MSVDAGRVGERRCFNPIRDRCFLSGRHLGAVDAVADCATSDGRLPRERDAVRLIRGGVQRLRTGVVVRQKHPDAFNRADVDPVPLNAGMAEIIGHLAVDVAGARVDARRTCEQPEIASIDPAEQRIGAEVPRS